MLFLWVFFFFFFFQAEDGIRDYKVTGVQTCALPILHNNFFLHRAVEIPLLLFVLGLNAIDPYASNLSARLVGL